MRTEDLIAALAADTTPPPRTGLRLGAALGLGLGAAGVLLGWGWGVRPDLAAALGSWPVLKTLVPAALAALALALVWRLVRPGARALGPAGALAAGLAAVAAGFALAMGREGGPGLAMALAKPDLWVCLASVPVLAAPALAGLLWALRAGAPLHPARAGAVAGLAAGGLGAAVYSLFCGVDMALFVIPAYGTAILGVSAAGALAGARALRW